MISSLCSVLTVKSVKLIAVAIEGLNAILEIGAKGFIDADGNNMFALEVERVGGVDSLERLQSHPNQYIYEQTFKLLQNHFLEDEDNLGLNTLATGESPGGEGQSNLFQF